MAATKAALLLAVLLSSHSVTKADYGDYVDPTFNCPAMTTCRQVCVATASDCPASMQCSGNETLCADGICAPFCTGNEVSPCEYKCAPFACPKVIDTTNNCTALYGDYYAAETACGEEETATETKLWGFNEPGFIFIYSWISGVTLLMLAWCAYNQRIAPVEGSTQSLELSFSTEGEKNLSRGYQTGYRFDLVGMFANIVTVATLVGIQVLLAFLTIQYYVQQELITGMNLVFEDEVQVLVAFELTWVIGFMWTFALKFPHSVRSMFLRRCLLGDATHVAIAVTDPRGDINDITFQQNYIQGLRNFFSSFFSVVHDVMTFLFSDKNSFGSPRSSNGHFEIVRVLRDPDDGTKYFVFRFRRYNLTMDRFVPGSLNKFNYIKDIVKADSTKGLSTSQVIEHRGAVGDNQISMKKPFFLRSLKNEISKPFYTYQIFMIWSWFPMWYYYMAFTWSILISTAALSVAFCQFRNECSLYKITETFGDVKVIRGGVTKVIPHQELVPGDIVIVEGGMAFCDMVVVSTTCLLLDESALTGEANHVGKVAVDPTAGSEVYNDKRHKRNTIFAGTTILETEGTRAIATKTGSFTSKGELIRDIYSFNRHTFKFDVEVPIVLTILFFYAIFAFTMTNYFIGDQFVYGFFYGIYVVGTILSPLLPTVFTVSVGVSDERLARKRIACTNAESILVAGKVKRAFFDKTGTLTRQGLDFLSVRSATDWNKIENEDQTQSYMSDLMATGMAVCHTLTRSQDGHLIGNPVDRVMFEAGNATMEGTNVTDKHGVKVTILKQFDFDHHTMTQSTIVQKSDGSIVAYVKGSGENIKALCKADTVPSDFEHALRESAIQGIYQISMAFKTLPSNKNISDLDRSVIESNLTFIGVVNFKNTMREDTPDVIRHLASGEIESIMVTGDSILTGIKIARESGIYAAEETVLVGSLEGEAIVWRNEMHQIVDLPSIDSMKASGTMLAVSGEAFEYLKSSSLNLQYMDLIRVYGRCTPHDKVAVVSQFVEQGYITMMCGDGGNDCGALKTAHVGIALSDAEASIVAPFTSLDKTITSVVDVLLEGRCALASAVACYKYIIIYGQVETLLQMTTAYLGITFAEWCWVFMDGIWTVSMAFSLPLSRPAEKLSPTRPTASVLGLQTLSSVCGILLINFLFQVSALAYLWQQDWFACRMWEKDDLSNVLIIGDNYESEVLFLVGGSQYITSAMAFNFGYEFRGNWFRNYMFVALITVYCTIMIYITFTPGELSCIWRVNCVNDNVRRSVTDDPFPIQNPYNTTVMPNDFQAGVFGLMMANALVISGYEFFVVNGIRRYYAAKKRHGMSVKGGVVEKGIV